MGERDTLQAATILEGEILPPEPDVTPTVVVIIGGNPGAHTAYMLSLMASMGVFDERPHGTATVVTESAPPSFPEGLLRPRATGREIRFDPALAEIRDDVRVSLPRIPMREQERRWITDRFGRPTRQTHK